MKKIFGGILSTILIELVKVSVNSACFGFNHQPELTVEAIKYSNLDK